MFLVAIKVIQSSWLRQPYSKERYTWNLGGLGDGRPVVSGSKAAFAGTKGNTLTDLSLEKAESRKALLRYVLRFVGA